MEVRPGYKQTEVGVLPADWTLEPLGKHATFRTGPFGSALHKSDYINDGVPVINPMHIVNGMIEPTRSMTVSENAAKKLSDFRMKAGEIVIGRRGDMGRCAVVQSHQAGWLCGTGSMIVRPINSDSNFLNRLLSSQRVISAIEESSVGTTMVNLNQASLASLKIQLPPIAEQRAIATALSDVDALLDGLTRLIAKKRDLKQAAMQQLLTGQTRLPGFSGAWKMRLLGDVAHITTGKRNNQDKVDDGIYPFFVRSATVERINSYSHDCEAILVPGEGQIGSIFHYISGRFDVHQRVYAITQFAEDVWGRYVHLYMSEHFGAWAMQNTVKATVDSLRLPTFQSFQLHLPPTLDEQSAVATVLSDMDAELAALDARLVKTHALKQAMVQELLTGKIRLI
ncbi:restriction endonuclease subunit S [Alicycliphilus sp. T452]